MVQAWTEPISRFTLLFRIVAMRWYTSHFLVSFPSPRNSLLLLPLKSGQSVALFKWCFGQSRIMTTPSNAQHFSLFFTTFFGFFWPIFLTFKSEIQRFPFSFKAICVSVLFIFLSSSCWLSSWRNNAQKSIFGSRWIKRRRRKSVHEKRLKSLQHKC